MESLKSIEIGFRRFLVKFLGMFIKRSRTLSASVDFNASKFLFVRQDRIGDVLVSTPLFAALKEAYPTAIVDIVLSENNYFVLDNEPLIRKRWVYKKNFFAIWKLLLQLRREHYDIVIDLMDNPSATSTLLLALAGGRWNIGLAKDNSYVYDVKVPLLSRKDVHIVERLAELLRPFQIDVDKNKLHVRYQVFPASAEFAARFWQSHLLEGALAIGINISSGSDARFWGVSNFQELVRNVQREYPLSRIVILFHPRDLSRAEEIASGLSNVTLSPETRSFDQFAAVVQRLSVLVTPDTSAVHIAAAFQIPSVVLYVQSNKELKIWEPYNAPSVTLVTDVDDLTTIPVSDVYASLQLLLPQLSQSHQKTTRPITVKS